MGKTCVSNRGGVPAIRQQKKPTQQKKIGFGEEKGGEFRDAFERYTLLDRV